MHTAQNLMQAIPALHRRFQTDYLEVLDAVYFKVWLQRRRRPRRRKKEEEKRGGGGLALVYRLREWQRRQQQNFPFAAAAAAAAAGSGDLYVWLRIREPTGWVRVWFLRGGKGGGRGHISMREGLEVEKV
ncbi:MAG: hypothetical protein Q9210_005035 [Variospora velana]